MDDVGHNNPLPGKDVVIGPVVPTSQTVARGFISTYLFDARLPKRERGSFKVAFNISNNLKGNGGWEVGEVFFGRRGEDDLKLFLIQAVSPVRRLTHQQKPPLIADTL